MLVVKIIFQGIFGLLAGFYTCMQIMQFTRLAKNYDPNNNFAVTGLIFCAAFAVFGAAAAFYLLKFAYQNFSELSDETSEPQREKQKQEGSLGCGIVLSLALISILIGIAVGFFVIGPGLAIRLFSGPAP